MGVKEGTCDEHWVFYVSDESLNPTCETNITVYVNYLEFKTWKNKKNSLQMGQRFKYEKLSLKVLQEKMEVVTPDTIKQLEEKKDGKLLDIGLSDIFWDLTPETMATKAKINKWDYIKLKGFCTVKETINKIKKVHIKALGWLGQLSI